MKIEIVKDKEEMARYISDYLVTEISNRTTLNLGCATGSTFEEVYHRLVEAHKQKNVSFSHVRTFNLDEYLDISDEHPETYKNTMERLLFNHVDIPTHQRHFPPSDEHAEYDAYDEFIRAQGGIDIQLLGIGVNGHIAFNEPGSSFTSKTHKVALSKSTRKANARFFDSMSSVPQYAITMGIQTIMNAKSIVLAASGKHKAKAVKHMIEGKIDESLPASVLRRHDDVTVVLDNAAAKHLKEG